MTIPLETYDPDWQTKWDAINAELERENAKPYDGKSKRRGEDLLRQLHEAFHAQFRTTGEYAEWTENNVRRMAEMSGVPDFEVPTFPREGSVQRTRNFYSLLIERIEKEAKMERHQLPLDYPTPGQPFTAELGSGEARKVSVMSHEYGMPILEGPNFGKMEKQAAPYGYVMDKKASQVNICFLQVSNDGPSPINCIEELATELYNAEFGAAAIAQGNQYYSPDKVDFYIYIPPRVYGDEKFIKVDLGWSGDKLAFSSPSWGHRDSVPYILRKQAAADGLAKDPDASPRSPGKRGAPEIKPSGQENG